MLKPILKDHFGILRLILFQTIYQFIVASCLVVAPVEVVEYDDYPAVVFKLALPVLAVARLVFLFQSLS